MSALIIVLTIVQLLTALATVLIVLFQSGKSAGLSGAIGGVADTFLAKNKAKSLDAKLAKMTKWFALAFVVLTLVLNLMARSGVGQETAVAEEPAAVTETAETEAEAEPAA